MKENLIFYSPLGRRINLPAESTGIEKNLWPTPKYDIVGAVVSTVGTRVGKSRSDEFGKLTFLNKFWRSKKAK